MTGRRGLASALIALAVAGIAGTQAIAGCRGSSAVGFGETLSSVAARCGVNVEALKQANPGIAQRDLANGGLVTVPRPPLPSAQLPVFGSPGVVKVTPPLIPSLR